MSDTNYTFDFSQLQSAAASFISGTSAGPSTSAAAPAASGVPASSGAPAGLPAGVDATTLLSASPFAPLLSLPGIDANSLLGSLSEGNGFATLGALGTPAGNPFTSLTGSGNPFPAGSANPFDNYVGANNPFLSSSNPFASINSTGA